MSYYVNPPETGFKTVLNYKNYVDKSELIAFINSVLDSPDMLIVSTRPRRFGKSFAAKMLAAYYSKGANAKSLFQNLKIATLDEERRAKALTAGSSSDWESALFEENLNRHDVIYIDITSFTSKSSDIKNTVKDLQSAVIRELKKEYPGCVSENTTALSSALMDVSAETGNRFFVIIDEWDALFREAKDDDNLHKEYINLLRSLFKTAETPQFIIGAYMTGILPVKKYGTESALTDFREFTMLEPGPLAPYIGFTEEEVKKLCETYGLDFQETQKWYDGYRFDNTLFNWKNHDKEHVKKEQHIYCPNSIMELVSKRRFDSYWTKTETYKSLRGYIDTDWDGLKESLVSMLGGKRCRINAGTFQNDMTSISCRDDVFTLLVHLGYLAYDFKSSEVYIPNEEVREEFITAVGEGKSYLRFEEIASGRGYSDILFLPRKTSSKPALLIELKWNKSAEKAISQITKMQYPQILENFDYEGDLLIIGLNYSTRTGRHTCKIEEYHR